MLNLFDIFHPYTPTPQIGGTWQPEAVALMREMLVNRSVDMVVVVSLTFHTRVKSLYLCHLYSHHEPASE